MINPWLENRYDKPVGDVARYATSLTTADLRSALATADLWTAAIDSLSFGQTLTAYRRTDADGA